LFLAGIGYRLLLISKVKLAKQAVGPPREEDKGRFLSPTMAEILPSGWLIFPFFSAGLSLV